MEDLDSRALEQAFHTPDESAHNSGLALDHRRQVEAEGINFHAEGLGLATLTVKARRPQEYLCRYAAHVEAGPADQSLLDEGHLLAHLPRVSGGFIAPGACTDNDQIVHSDSACSILSRMTFKNLAPGAPSMT